jgi:hypothetical protein
MEQDNTPKRSQSFSSQYLIKFAICSILLFTNIGFVVAIIGSVINILQSYLSVSYKGLLFVNILSYVVTMVLTICTFLYFSKNMEPYIEEKSINKALLINIVVYPLVYVLNFGLSLLHTYFFTRNSNTMLIAEYYQYSNIIKITGAILNMMILTALGIIALVRRSPFGSMEQ